MVLGVVNDTLDLSKAESGRLVLVVRPFSLQALCQRVARMGQALAEGNHRAVQVRAAAVPVDRVVGDELRLQQVLLNLVSNAVKFSSSGVVEIACTRCDDRPDDAVLLRFSISDNGSGLSPSEQAQLFTPYTRLAGADRGAEGGTGLGLFLCQQIVGLMGGSIGVNSQPGEGSQFWFTAPLGLQADPARAEGGHGPASTPWAPTPQRRLENRWIAVVDDARLSREVAERIIRSAGGRCLLFASAEAFLEHLRVARPHLDVVLMDLELPGMDGFTACEQMRQIEGLQAVPVVAVTGTEAGLVATELERSGLQGHVLKPFHAASLVAAVVALLGLSAGS